MDNYEILFSLNKLAGNITNYANNCLKPYEITYTQLNVLLFLEKKQQQIINQKHICKELDISHSTGVGIITRMYGKSLVNIVVSETDRRNTNISLTKKGIDLIIQTQDIQAKIADLFYQGLSELQVKKFFKDVSKINQVFKM